jgi:hypothetical protein
MNMYKLVYPKVNWFDFVNEAGYSVKCKEFINLIRSC